MASFIRTNNASPVQARRQRRCRRHAVMFCIAAWAALIVESGRSIAQEMDFQSLSYPAAGPLAPPAPSWEDFNALAARLQATEARLQAMTSNVTYDTAYDYYQPNGQPSGQSSLSATTQTPENMPAILSRTGARCG